MVPGARRSDLDWMTLQAETLYEHDGAGRLLRANSTPGDASDAPLLFWGRTQLGGIWRLHHELPDEVLREVARLVAAEPTSPRLEREPERLATVRERLEAFRPIRSTWSGPAFSFPDELPAAPDTRELAASELPRVAAAFPQLASTLEGRAPWLVVEREGQLASVCYCATRPGLAVEAGVETAPAWRGQGLASQVVAAWARAVRTRGALPLYSTVWQNAPSRGVARRLGLLCYGADLSLR